MKSRGKWTNNLLDRYRNLRKLYTYEESVQFLALQSLIHADKVRKELERQENVESVGKVARIKNFLDRKRCKRPEWKNKTNFRIAI